MENKDSSPMLYCLGVVTPLNSKWFKGDGSPMPTHHSVAALFIDFKKGGRTAVLWVIRSWGNGPTEVCLIVTGVLKFVCSHGSSPIKSNSEA